MATNSEHPRRFDLRTTIPLATETLVHLAKQPKRSWIVPALTLFTGIAFGLLMLELLVFPGSASALAFEGGLRSRLLANYGTDPITARIHELRLTIVEDVLGMDEMDSSDPPAIALLMQDPVPSATPKASAVSNPTASAADPTASPESTDAFATQTSLPAPTETPPPPTAVAAPVGYCGNLSITGMWVDGDDDVEANVRNRGSRRVYLIKTVFEWPDVPDPAYVDWFKFDGDRYYSSNDGDSPTVSTGDHERLRGNRTRRWETDFDDQPEVGIYGSFFLTLTFDVPDQGAHCTVSGGTFKAPPAPTPEPSDIPTPSETPEPAPTVTPELILTDTPVLPTDTPEPAPTETVAPTDPPAATETFTPEPADTP